MHYSVQTNHLHLLCEARGLGELARGIQGLAIRLAQRLNRLWRRSGTVFGDRYHDHVLRTPREVRRALVYVLNNARKHGIALPSNQPDPCSSGRWFEGWRDWTAEGVSPLAKPRTWLLATGWLRHGKLHLGESPGALMARARSAMDPRESTPSARESTPQRR